MPLFHRLSQMQPDRSWPHRFPITGAAALDAPLQDGAAALISVGHLHERGAAARAGRDADPMPLRCLIVDDNTRFLETARFLLEREGLTIVGLASTGEQALRLIATLEPDVVLVDVMLGAESGFELAGRLVQADPTDRASVILISTHAEADFAELIEASPAAGFLAKSELSAGGIRDLHDSRPR